jgi:predicted dehydrogenase
MNKLSFGMIGAGFWSQYQLAGWYELGDVECVAICNRTLSKAQSLARRFAVRKVYADAREMLRENQLDFVDVVTDVGTHAQYVQLAAEHHLPVVCQKPIAPDLATAKVMVRECQRSMVPLLINENWRWQAPIRALKNVLQSGVIGRPFRARIDMISGFPVFQNQPFLKELDQFILTDLGSHLLDTARFLFGEVESLYCQTHRVHADIKGENVATVVLRMRNCCTVLVQMAYAENHVERECFPQTLIFVEGKKGSAEILPDYLLRVTSASGTTTDRHAPARYSWVDPAYEVVHSSIVSCQADLLEALRGGSAETTGEDNLKTVQLVFACYNSAANNRVVSITS